MGLIKLLRPEGGPIQTTSLDNNDDPAHGLKSWQVDPFVFLQSVTHKERPSSLSFEMLRQMAMRTAPVGAILQVRVNQVATFSDPQVDRHEMGYVVKMRDPKAKATPAAQKRIQELTNLVHTCGTPGYGQDHFDTFLRKITWDSLVYDGFAAELVPRQDGKGPVYWQAVDAATIRLAADAQQPRMDMNGMKDMQSIGIGQQPPQAMGWQGAYDGVRQMLTVNMPDGSQQHAKYVQIMEGMVRSSFADSELMYGIRNPRTNVYNNGYGVSELETMVTIVTAYLWAEQFNMTNFTSAALPRGILNIKGELTEKQLQAFRREWVNLISGVTNSNKTPVINADDINYIPLNNSNNDMQFTQWMQFLVRILSSLYLIDPFEINFDMSKGLDQTNPLFEGNNEAKLRASKERGLHPLLKCIARNLNHSIFHLLDPDFSFAFVGLSAKTEMEELAEDQLAVSTHTTLNEIRAKRDQLPLPDGDVILNPVYLGQEQAEQAM